MDSVLIIGYLASVCSVTSFIPQVMKVVRSGDTAAISARMYTGDGDRLCLVVDIRDPSTRMAHHPYQLCVFLSCRVHPLQETEVAP